MNKLVWRNIGRFLLLVLFQLLVLNNVWMGGYVMRMLYVLFILMLPTGMNRSLMLAVAFVTGLTVDAMNNMLGFHALACTAVAMMRILFTDRILTRGEPVEIAIPGIRSVTPPYYLSYLMLMLAAFYLVFFTTELFGFRGFGDVLLATICSTVVTTLLAVLYQLIFTSRKESL